MRRLKTLLLGLGTLAAAGFFFSSTIADAQEVKHPADDALANEPAPWTVPGKWGPRGNWGRWGEQDKRGMLNFITPEMIVKATEHIDAEAQRRGFTSADAYTAQWKWGDEQQRNGSAQQVADAVKSELLAKLKLS